MGAGHEDDEFQTPDRRWRVTLQADPRQVEAWGPIPATNRVVEYDEIVTMSIRDGRVCHQVGLADNLLALQQLGAVADPSGFTTGSSPRVRPDS